MKCADLCMGDPFLWFPKDFELTRNLDLFMFGLNWRYLADCTSFAALTSKLIWIDLTIERDTFFFCQSADACGAAGLQNHAPVSETLLLHVPEILTLEITQPCQQLRAKQSCNHKRDISLKRRCHPTPLAGAACPAAKKHSRVCVLHWQLAHATIHNKVVFPQKEIVAIFASTS